MNRWKSVSVPLKHFMELIQMTKTWRFQLWSGAGDENDDVRNAVVAVLADCASEAFPALIHLLRKGEASIRPTIAWGLSRMLETIPQDRLQEGPIALLRKACGLLADVRHCAIVFCSRGMTYANSLSNFCRVLRDADRRIRRFAVTILCSDGSLPRSRTQHRISCWTTMTKCGWTLLQDSLRWVLRERAL